MDGCNSNSQTRHHCEHLLLQTVTEKWIQHETKIPASHLKLTERAAFLLALIYDGHEDHGLAEPQLMRSLGLVYANTNCQKQHTLCLQYIHGLHNVCMRVTAAWGRTTAVCAS